MMTMMTMMTMMRTMTINENHENEYYDASDNTTGIAGVMDDKNENEINIARVRFEEDTIPEVEPKQNVDTAGVTGETVGVNDKIINTAGVLRHVDDLKISHMKDEVINNVISTLSE